MSDARLEGDPTDDQKERLEDFLSELMILSRRYRYLLHQEGPDLRIIDVERNTIVGVDLMTLADSDTGHVYSYLPEDSIFDGDWLVDTADGPQDQRSLGRTWPRKQFP